MFLTAGFRCKSMGHYVKKKNKKQTNHKHHKLGKRKKNGGKGKERKK